MRAAAIDGFGGDLSKLSLHQLPIPEVSDDEILIKVESAGVGVWDPFEMEGGFAKLMGTTPKFPYVPGSDGAGTVEEVGKEVNGIKKGDRVYALALANPKGGFYAEYIVVKARDASAIPKGLSVEQAGVFPVDAVTAMCGLEETLHLKQGETVLIFGASGGIGHLAVQLAKRMGARVFAVASGADGVELVKRIGADVVVDGRQGDVLAEARKFAPGGIDCALVTAGGKAAEKVIEAVKDGGRVAYPNGVEPAPKGRPGISATAYDGRPSPELIRKINGLVEQGAFEVHVARTFSLEQAGEALRALEGHYLGKLALRP
jgi:NADPH:quinone reductase-like Zn-dependent oxidoreductase